MLRNDELCIVRDARKLWPQVWALTDADYVVKVRVGRSSAGSCAPPKFVERVGFAPCRGVAGARALRASGPPIRKPRRAHVALPEDVPCSPGTPRSDRDGRPRPWAPSRSWRWKPSYACVCVERVEATRVRGMTGAGAPRLDWRDGEEA